MKPGLFTAGRRGERRSTLSLSLSLSLPTIMIYRWRAAAQFNQHPININRHTRTTPATVTSRPAGNPSTRLLYAWPGILLALSSITRSLPYQQRYATRTDEYQQGIYGAAVYDGTRRESITLGPTNLPARIHHFLPEWTDFVSFIVVVGSGSRINFPLFHHWEIWTI